MEKTKPIFVDGLIPKLPEGKAAEFINFKLSIKRENLINWLQGQQGEWI